jgi:hypothetical protein
VIPLELTKLKKVASVSLFTLVAMTSKCRTVYQKLIDRDPCTVDECVPENTTCVITGCVNTPIDCSDEVLCTVDSCCDGVCKHEANDTVCDDGVPCTVDYCSIELGRCVNLPDDSLCTDDNQCLILSCNPGLAANLSIASGCVSEEVNCDDDMDCTEDWCDPSCGFCQYTANNTLCDDELECTVDTCDVEVGRCVNLPDNSLCNDTNACTTDACDSTGTCVFTEVDCKYIKSSS